MPHDAAVTEALRRLDAMEAEVSDWEANFLTSLLARPTCTPKQRHILVQMVEKYLPADGLAAELAGQGRLPGLEG
jgi:hypothetical protein